MTDSHSTTDELPVKPVSEPLASKRTIGRRERLASAAIGGLLVIRGLKKRSLGGVATALAGGVLVYRGVTGQSRLYAALESDVGLEDEGESAETDEAEADRRPTVERSITIDESPDELADRLRDPEQLNRIIGPFADLSGADGDGDRHHWEVKTPVGRALEWDMKLSEDESDDGGRMHWESANALVPHEYTLSFESAPADRGTEVSLELQYDPPGGSVGNAAMDKLGFAPTVLVGTALGRLKSLAETGEIPTTETNPSGRGAGDLV